MSEKYGITDAHYLCDSAIFNTENDEILRLYEICDLLNQQDQRIAELEEQLKNAIVPKFKYHQVVYAVFNDEIIKGQIDCFDYYNKKYLVWFMGFDLVNEWCYENELFATKEEAQAKLKELKG